MMLSMLLSALLAIGGDPTWDAISRDTRLWIPRHATSTRFGFERLANGPDRLDLHFSANLCLGSRETLTPNFSMRYAACDSGIQRR